MPTHLDPAFIEPSPVAPVERDTETLDIFAPADDQGEQPAPAEEGDE